MNWRLGIHIPKGQTEIVFVNNVRWDFAANNFAKNGVATHHIGPLSQFFSQLTSFTRFFRNELLASILLAPQDFGTGKTALIKRLGTSMPIALLIFTAFSTKTKTHYFAIATIPPCQSPKILTGGRKRLKMMPWLIDPQAKWGKQTVKIRVTKVSRFVAKTAYCSLVGGRNSIIKR